MYIPVYASRKDLDDLRYGLSFKMMGRQEDNMRLCSDGTSDLRTQSILILDLHVILNPNLTSTCIMAPLTSIRTTDGRLEIVNQLLLPHTTEFIEIKSIEEAHDAIKSMKASYTG